MAVYPPPLVPSTIFNSALFSEATTAIVSSGSPAPITQYVEYPEPQGELTFLNGTGVRTTISASAVSLFQNLGISEDGVAFNAVGIAYQPPDAAPVAITWNNLATKVEAIAAITQASDATTLNVNNSIQIQNGETQSSPIQYITIKSDNSGNRIGLDGNYGDIGNVLVSGGSDGNLVWGSGGGSLVGTLAEVLNNGNTAQRNLDMNGYTIENAVIQLSELNVATDPITIPLLESAGTVVPITLNGTTYYLQLFSEPP